MQDHRVATKQLLDRGYFMCLGVQGAKRAAG